MTKFVDCPTCIATVTGFSTNFGLINALEDLSTLKAAKTRADAEVVAAKAAAKAQAAPALVVKYPPDEEEEDDEEEEEEEEEQLPKVKKVFGPGPKVDAELRKNLDKAHLTTEELNAAGIYKCYLRKEKGTPVYKIFTFPKDDNGIQQQVLVPELREFSSAKRPLWWIGESYYMVPELLRSVLCPANGAAGIPEVNRDTFLDAIDAIDFLEKQPMPNRQRSMRP